MSAELFEIPSSDAPPLVRLRAKYAEALEDWKEADAHEDESGEAVPLTLRKRLEEARTQLMQEEAKQVRPAGQ